MKESQINKLKATYLSLSNLTNEEIISELNIGEKNNIPLKERECYYKKALSEKMISTTTKFLLKKHHTLIRYSI